jgi:hypothetical protein
MSELGRHAGDAGEKKRLEALEMASSEAKARRKKAKPF